MEACSQNAIVGNIAKWDGILFRDYADILSTLQNKCALENLQMSFNDECYSCNKNHKSRILESKENRSARSLKRQLMTQSTKFQNYVITVFVLRCSGKSQKLLTSIRNLPFSVRIMQM